MSEEEDTCMSEEEDTCMSEEEDTCARRPLIFSENELNPPWRTTPMYR
jgi:hypothetical protein